MTSPVATTRQGRRRWTIEVLAAVTTTTSVVREASGSGESLRKAPLEKDLAMIAHDLEGARVPCRPRSTACGQ
mgnify:CR=1 FL=1